MGDSKSQELTNLAWAFATTSQSDVQLFRVLARAVVCWVDEFDVKSLANVAWAFGTAG